jgi:hypothetical protein
MGISFAALQRNLWNDGFVTGPSTIPGLDCLGLTRAIAKGALAGHDLARFLRLWYAGW